MAVTKIIFDFSQQPILITDFGFKLYVNGTILTYANGLSDFRVSYKTGSNAIQRIGRGVDLNETINKTLAFFGEQGYTFSGSIAGYSVVLSYARVGNTIEMSINTASPKVTLWNVVSLPTYVLLRPENPCKNAFLSNAVSANADPIYSLSNGFYIVKNITLNTYTPVTVSSGFSANALTPTFERGFSYSIQTTGGTALLNFSLEGGLSEANTSVYFSGNTLYIIAGTSMSIQYSLDSVNFQNENSFPDLEPGDYIAYTRDPYGCIKQFPISNSGDQNNTNIAPPYAYISESNSLRMIRRVEHQNCSNYKNVYNTLSCEENTSPANKFIQLFQGCDTITTQVKTSYQNLAVAAGTTEITPNKIVANIGVQDKRDAYYYNYLGNLAVIFNSGNTYEYDTTTITGTYELNGDLPPFGTLGTWVETPFGNFQIIDIRVADNGDKSLILNSNANPIDPNQTIQTIYNREDYDIWEFTIAMADFLNQSFQVAIKFFQTVPDADFPDIFYISEVISVKERWPRTTEIVWRHSKNTDIYFFSGITMKNRLSLCDVNTNTDDGEVDFEVTDNVAISIDSTNYNKVDFKAINLSTGMARKIALALKHNYLTIDEVPYVLSENPALERSGESNMYKVTAKLIEASEVWSQSESAQNTLANIEMIGLLRLNDTDQYLRIK